MHQVTKILPPAQLSPRVVPLSSPRESVVDYRRGEIHAAVIAWRDLVLATWQLREGLQYTGELPAGLSSQQFWAKVTRAARAMGGEVGIVTKGRRWWVWSKRAGVVPPKPRANSRDSKFKAAWERLEMGLKAQIKGRLTKLDIKSLREKARSGGFRLGIMYVAESGNTVVWRI